jgi:transcriptional regulator with XRE-family HTH domain
MTFGERLRQLRERAGLTQERLAERSAINLWTIRGYEQGRREPSWKGAISLAAALGVGVEEAFADCDETPLNEPRRGRPRTSPANGTGRQETPDRPPRPPRGRPRKAN